MMTRFISIMGAKDRVGASTFSFELAAALKKMGRNVLLLDWDEAHLGDLRLVSDSRVVWRDLKDLQKIPRPISFSMLTGFLKGPLGISCLGLAEERSQLSEWAPSLALNQLSLITPVFDTILADIGSRWGPFNNILLDKTDLLLFVLNSEISLVHEVKRKLDELAPIYFPMKRLGWMGTRWDPKYFLTPDATTDLLKIGFYGDSVDACCARLEEIIPREQSGQNLPEFHPPTLNKVSLLQAIQERMELKGIKAEAKEEGLRAKISKIVLEILEEKSAELPPSLDRSILVGEFLDELLGLGPLESLLAQSHLGEILVNGTNFIYVEEAGRLKETSHKFLNRDSLQKVIERILLPVGRRVDESSPMVDARLKCGSRVNIILPPLALDGPIISIRRFSKKVLTPRDLISWGSVNEVILQFLEGAVQSKLNILVSGGTGSGKTTLLNILSSFIPKEERIITIEDAAELSLNQPHVVRLEARPPNIEGKGGITIRDLVRNTLRMRPDRIVVGECRGAEALDMLSAMNTGHDGSLTTLHANSPRDALSRLETLVMFAGMELPSKAIRDQIASAIDLVVQIARRPDGSRKIISITKITGMEGDIFTLQDLFTYENEEFVEASYVEKHF